MGHPAGCREEEAAIPGLTAPVSITFDAYGIPRIRAENEEDAARALGFLHARDRMFQMEMMRRSASGRLAEILGAPALRLDRYLRTLGLAQRAEADLAALPEEVQRLLAAYAEGVNARIAARGRFLAPEFLALGAPAPWRPADSLLWGKLMGLWLSANAREELERLRLAGVMPPERIADLWPEDDQPRPPRWQRPLRSGSGGTAARPAAALPSRRERRPRCLQRLGAGAPAQCQRRGAACGRSASRLLRRRSRGIWRIDLPGGRFRAGATAPGVPLVVIGRNERVAWGFTTPTPTPRIVVVERLAGPDAYQTEDGPGPSGCGRSGSVASSAERRCLEGALRRATAR